MLEVITPLEPDFLLYKNSVRNLYIQNQEKICDPNSFEFIINKTLFYLFVKNKRIIGAIYYFLDNEKLFLNGFSERKTFNENIEALKLSTTWFKSNIYAEAQNRASALCLLRAGFKRLKGNLFILQRYN